ncbi:MAG: SDR family oxidoreductase [Deltaproteobacteria bacterium]|nr:SDR family oxidoreductase [Deltaproteobacteria bacterium]
MLSTGVGFGGKTEGDGVDWDAVAQIIPNRRVGTMEDITGLAVFLSSRAGAYVVGETITCDGGAVACR